MAKQTAKDRMVRLANGCCPIHGFSMTQVDNTKLSGEHFFVTECPRRDCVIQGVAREPGGATKLLPAFQRILGPTVVP